MNTALFFLFLILPTYLIRFHIGPLPTTVLEVMALVVIGAWIVKGTKNKEERHQLVSSFKFQVSKNRLLFIFLDLFLLAATISIFTSVNIRAALGEWKAFYIEPFLIFLVLISIFNFQFSIFKQFRNSSILQFIIFPLILCGLAVSLLAIYQHFTGWMVPYAFWENGNSYRVTAWYGFPNAVGLFLAPLIPLSIYLVKQSWARIKNRIIELRIKEFYNSTILQFFTSLLFIPCSILAIIFAKSTGGLIGVATGLGVLLLFNKKTRLTVCLVGLVSIVGLVILPSNNPIKQELLAQNRSGQIHTAIWKETARFLRDHPISGTGLASYKKRIIPYHTKVNGENIEIFHHPHNIFLTMWVNLGLLGLLGFIGIIGWFFYTGFHLTTAPPHHPTTQLPLFLLASMMTLLATGLADSPYIKNDLSIFFWLLIALMVGAGQTDKKQVE